MENPEILILVLIFYLIIIAVFLGIVLTRQCKRKKIINNSKRIEKLKRINSAWSFAIIKQEFRVTKECKYKREYYNVRADSIVKSYIGDNILFFDEYVAQVLHNRKKYNSYIETISKIPSEITKKECEQLRIPYEEFIEREEAIVNKSIILRPVIDCKFTVVIKYSSPKGKVNLDRKAVFGFEQVFSMWKQLSSNYINNRELYSTVNGNQRNANLYEKHKDLMTECEKMYYKSIKKIVGDKYIVQPQVNLATVVNKLARDDFRNELFRNIDFGIFNSNYEIQVLVEINDKTHERSDRRERDKKVYDICVQSGIPIVVFWTSQGINENYMAQVLGKHLDLKSY